MPDKLNPNVIVVCATAVIVAVVAATAVIYLHFGATAAAQTAVQQIVQFVVPMLTALVGLVTATRAMSIASTAKKTAESQVNGAAVANGAPKEG